MNHSFVFLVVALSLGTFLGLVCTQRRRSPWVRKQCPACRWYIPARARRCAWCQTWQATMLGGLLLVSAAPAHAGCLPLSFFAEPCVDEEGDAQPVPPPPVQLFPKDAVAVDTPPALLQMLQQPQMRTLAQAQRYHAEVREKERILQQVQQLIQQAAPPLPKE